MKDILLSGESATPLREAEKDVQAEKTLRGSHSQFLNYIEDLAGTEAFTDQDIYDTVHGQVIDRLGENVGKFDAKTLQDMVDFDYESTKQVHASTIKAKQIALQEAIQQGGGQHYYDLYGTPEQELALREGRAWKRTPHQTVLEMAKSVPPEQLTWLLRQLGTTGQLEDATPQELEEYDRLSGEEMYGPVSAGGALNTLATGLGVGGRGMQSAGTGALQQLQREAAQKDPEESGLKWYDFASAPLTAVPIVGPLVGARLGQKLWGAVPEEIERQTGVDPMEGVRALKRGAEYVDEALTPESKWLKAPATAARVMASPLTAGLEGAMFGLKHMTPGGGDVGTASAGQVSQVLNDPMALARIAKEAYAMGIHGASSKERTVEMARELEAIGQTIYSATVDEVKTELGPQAQQMPPEQLQEMIDAKYKDNVQSNLLSSGIENPDEFQLIFEAVLDPLNVMGALPFKMAGAGIKKAVSLGKQIPKIGPGVEVVEKGAKAFAKGFDWNKPARAMEQAGYTDEGALTRMAADEGSAAARDVLQLKEKYGKELSGVSLTKPLGFNKKEKQLLMDALEGRLGKTEAETLEQLPKNMRKAFTAGRNLKTELYQTGTDLGVLQRFEGEKLTQAPARDWYVPHKKMTEEGKKLTDEGLYTESGKAVQGQLDVAAARQRKLPDKYYEADPTVQFEKAINEMASKAESAKEIKQLHKFVGGDSGFITDIPATVSVKDLQKVKKMKEEITGMEWTVLKDDLAEAVDAVVGKPGVMTRGGYNKLVTKDMADRLKEIVPLVGGNAAAINKSYQTLAKANAKWIRPYMSVWRTGKTVLGGPMYFVRNAVTAPMLSGLALGMRAFNPKLQAGAFGGALMSAGMGKKAFSKMPLKLRGGKKITLEEGLGFAHKVNLLDQWELKAGLEQLSKFKGGNIAQKAQKAFQGAAKFFSPAFVPLGPKASAATVGKVTDNYLKLNVFLGALENTTDTAIAKANKFASEYAGNYRHITNFEKNAISDVFGFYNWMRFIFPHVTKQVAKNPQRMAKFIQTRNYLKRKNDRYSVFSEYQLPEWQRGFAVPAGKELQSGEDFKTTTLMLEDAYYMGMSWVPMFQNILGQKAMGPDATRNLGPAIRLGIEMLTGRDAITGNVIPRFPRLDLSDVGFKIGKRKSSVLGKFISEPMERMSEGAWKIYKMYIDNRMLPEALSFVTKLKMGRDNWALSDLLNTITGKEMSVRSDIPGASAYQTSTLQQGARSVSKPIRGLLPRERSLEEK